MSKHVVAMYEDFATARAVVEDLVNAGFSRENISIVAADSKGDYARYATSGSGDDDVSSGEGAGFGAVVGALVGLGVALIPGVGPVLAAGPLAAALMAGVGAATGAVTGGVVAGLVDLGVPEEDARYYEEGIRSGRSMVSVTVEDAAAGRAQDIMNRHGAIDVHAEYGSATPTQTANYSSTTGTTGTTGTTMPREQEQARFDVVEEEVHVGKREVESGGVRVRSYVTSTPVEEQIRLREEHVTVERNPVNRPASEADIAAFQEGVIEVTEHHEEAVVAKEARVVEEVVVGKEVSEHVETIHETVRRTDVEVENLGSTGTTYGTYETYEPRFRNLYSTRFGSSGGSYESYLPAYRYGHTLATDSRYSGYDWSRVESEARRSWEERNPNSWERFKDAVHDAWMEVTGRS